MTTLGNVLEPLDESRGADVEWHVDVARDALTCGAQLRLGMPRRLACALCHGGGCDACQRRGAVTLREADDPPEQLDVVLGEQVDDAGVRLRIPNRGGAGQPGEPRGHVELTLVPADHSSDCVAVLERRAPPRASTIAWLPWLLLPALIGAIYAVLSSR